MHARLVQLCDSALPVGGFSFSNTLESAVAVGLVHDAATLERYTHSLLRTALHTDGIVALMAYRARLAGDFGGIMEADREAVLCKLNSEARRMSERMGRKLAELACRIFPDPQMERWLGQVRQGRTAGSFAVAQGVMFAVCGCDERSLVAAHRYGVASVVLNAALRLLRVSHYDTQEILFRLAARAEEDYSGIAALTAGDIAAFAPQCDIMASLHEKGNQRLFMS